MQPERFKSNRSKLLYDFCRYFVAPLIITYGWAKIMGSQFTVLDSELDKPMRSVSGFWLTWYFFGYSSIYGNLIAVIQIICGFLLLYRKSVLLAACVLCGILGNIVLIDIFYGIDFGGLLPAVVLEICVVIILSYHRQELFDFFWTKQNSIFGTIPTAKTFTLLKNILIILFVAFPPCFTYYLANYNNRRPTELDGRWKIANTSLPVVEEQKPLTKLYFENNRAFMVVFRYGDSEWIKHHFETNPSTKELRIWEKHLTKDTEIFEGKYQIAEKKLILDGTLKSSNQPLKIELEKEY